MSTLTTYMLTIPGIIYLGNTDVATGTTTLTDLTGTFAAGTELNAGVSRAGFGATGFVTGHSTCWESAAVNRGFQIAAAATATAQLQSLTYGVFIRQTSAANSPTPLLGRQNGIYLATTSLKHMSAVVSGGGVTAPGRTNPTTFTVNTGHLIGVTYDGQELQPWVDGSREGLRQRLTGPFTTFLNRVAFGGDTGSTGAGTQACLPFIVSGVIDDDVWAKIYELGLGATTAADVAGYDYVVDGITEVAASATATLRCRGCRGRRRDAEGGVKSATQASHIACYGARGFWSSTRTTALGSSPTDRELDMHALRLIEGVTDQYCSRPTTDTTYYLDTTGQLQPGAQTANYGGMIGALGSMHHYAGGGPYSPFLQKMKLMMGYLYDNRIATGLTKAGWFSTNGTFAGEFGGNGVFIFSQLLPGVIAVWNDLDAATKTEWITLLRDAADAEWAWEGANYWANGNIIMYIWSIFRQMATLDPTQTRWQTYADAYLDYFFTPVGSSSYVAGTLTGVGCRKYVDGTPTNDPLLTLTTFRALTSASDKVYLTEGSGSATGPGSTLTTTYGLDWNYVGAQGSVALQVYHVTGDTDALKFAHMMYNTQQPRHNLTSGSVTGPSGSAVPAWYSDLRGGTRINAAAIGHIYGLHTLRRLGRTDLLTGAQQQGHELFIENDAVLNTTQQNVWYRSSGDVGMFLWGSPYWPTVVI